MNDDAARQKREGRGGWAYRDTVRALKSSLRPMEPSEQFSRRLEGMCESMGAIELFGKGAAVREGGGHRGVIIGGAILSALPFLGVAAYAIGKHVLRRRLVPVGV